MYEETVPVNGNPEVVTSSKEKLSYWGVVGLILLIPLFFVPSLSIPLSISKNILLYVGLVICSILFLIGIIKQGSISIPKTKLMWGAILLPLTYFISSLTSISKAVSLFGYNLEVGTFASIVALFGLMALTTLVINNRAKLIKSHAALYISFILVALFALVKIFTGGNILVLNNFSGNLGNPIGSWTDYSIYFGLFALLSTLVLQNLPLKKLMKFFLYGALLVSVFMLVVINFSLAWILVLGGSVVILALSLLEKNENNDSNTKRNLSHSKFAIGLAVISLLFVFNPTISSTTGSIGNSISSLFNIQNTEVRPSWGATFDVTKPILKSDPLLGSGPNTFSEEWLYNKPAVINGTAFWNVAFPFGVGFLPTQIAAVGIVGGILWLIFAVLLILLGIKALWKNPPQDKTQKYLVTSSFIAALFLWIAMAVYVPSLVMLALTFIMTGLFISSAVVGGVVGSKTLTLSGKGIKNLLGIGIVLIFLLGVIVFGFKSFQKTVAAIYFQEALVAANNGSQTPEWVKDKITKAIGFSPEDLYYRALSTLAFTKAQQIVSSVSAATPDQLEAFQLAYSESITAAQKAIDANPGNYENWVALGGLYEALVPAPLSVQGAYENSKAAYVKAQEVNPKSPEIPLVLARLELSNQNVAAARTHIEESLALKNDYAAAYFLLARLELSANNTATAIKAAEAGAILSPGNAGVFFELGLLKYSNKDFLGAGQAFAQAIKIVPNYANAQYFLGLSMYELNMKEEALGQFRELLKTNPDSTEVKSIISNLESGRAPLFPGTSQNAGPTKQTNPPLESAPKR